jgi:hypothetical protein
MTRKIWTESVSVALMLVLITFATQSVVQAQERSPKSNVAIVSESSPGPTAQGALDTDAALNQALKASDADALNTLLADDWIVVSSQGGIGEKVPFVSYVRQGHFVRTKMNLSEPRVRLYGNTALVTTHLATAGHRLVAVNGKPAVKCFDVKERQTDVLVWRNGVWQSVLLHETVIPGPESGCA